MKGIKPINREQGRVQSNVPAPKSAPAPIQPLANPATNKLDSLPDDAKNFIAHLLTPEFAVAIGMLGGPELGSALMKHADQNKILVPMDRQSVLGNKNNESPKGETFKPTGKPAGKPPGKTVIQPDPSPAVGPSQV